jgi:endoglycosylceramidase
LIGLFAMVACRPCVAESFIHDAQGRIVVYHGVNVSNAAKYAPNFLSWHTREDYVRLNGWGLNLVRYLTFWSAIEPTDGTFDDAYLDAVVERVQWMRDLGIDTVIDFHQDLYSLRYGGNGFPDWTLHDGGHSFTPRQPWNLNYLEPAVLSCYDYFWRSDALQDRYVAMLEHVMQRLDGLPNVAGFEIMNEPWPWLGLGFERRVLTHFYDKVQAMRRRNGFKTRLLFEPVIYTSTGFPSSLRFKPDPGSVYSVHYYDPLVHEGMAYTGIQHWLMRAAVYIKVREAARFDTPLMFTEFGVAPATPNADAYLEDFLGLMDRYGASWTYYSYDMASAESFGILDANKDPTPILAHLVRVYPQRIAGSHPAWQYGENRFELRYEANDSAAPTELFVPGALKTVRVTINGQDTAFEPGATRIIHINPPDGGTQTIVVEWAQE